MPEDGRVGDTATTTTTHTTSNHRLPTVCAVCNQAFTAQEAFRQFDGKGYHPRCFTCTVCKSATLGSEFLVTDGGPVCEACSPPCDRCGQPITSNHITFATHHFHQDCASCLNCGQRFTNLESALQRNRVPRCPACSTSVFARDASAKSVGGVSVKDLQALGCDVTKVLTVSTTDGADADDEESAASLAPHNQPDVDDADGAYMKFKSPAAVATPSPLAGPASAAASNVEREYARVDDDPSGQSMASMSEQGSGTYEKPQRLVSVSTDARDSPLYACISETDSSVGGSTLTLNGQPGVAAAAAGGKRGQISAPTMDAGFSARLFSLSKMLEDNDGIEALTQYAAKCFVLEYVLFWLDCEQFRNFDGTFEDLRSYADMIARKYLLENSELHVTLPPEVHDMVVHTIEAGPHTHALFLDAQMHAFREISEILPAFFKSPEGLQYSRRAIDAAQQQFFDAKSKAVMPVSASIVAFEKIYLATEKYYSYKIRVKAEDAEFSIWRRYSELHKLSVELKVQYPSASTAQFPPKRIFSRSQVRSVASKRQAELDAYVQSIVSNETLRTSALVSTFLRQTLKDIAREQEECHGAAPTHKAV
eukprot:m.104081 g.104081  ORF g.104081 m.104081 type:complete len:593 (+) comp10508_c0_seq1:460-2238(+)